MLCEGLMIKIGAWSLWDSFSCCSEVWKILCKSKSKENLPFRFKTKIALIKQLKEI